MLLQAASVVMKKMLIIKGKEGEENLEGMMDIIV
jgi:hypothetical protein